MSLGGSAPEWVPGRALFCGGGGFEFALEVPDEEGDIAGTDAGDAGGLADGEGPHAGELFGAFVTESADRGEVVTGGYGEVFELALLLGFFGLAAEIAAVDRFDFDLATGGDIRSAVVAIGLGAGGESSEIELEGVGDLLDFFEGHCGTADELEETRLAFDGRGVEGGEGVVVAFEDVAFGEEFFAGGDGFAFGFETADAFGGGEAEFDGERGEAAIGVVVAEEEAMLGAGGEHPVGVFDAFCDEVVHHDTDEGAVAGEDEGGLLFGLEGGIDAGEDALTGGFFVAGGAVDLSGEVEAGEELGFEGGAELGGVCHVVFDGVTGAEHVHIFEAGDGFEGGELDFGGHGGAEALDVDGFAVPLFDFEEDGVAVFIGEANDFVFDAGAVAGADAFDLAAEHRALIEVRAEDVVSVGVGVGLPGGEEFALGKGVVVEFGEGASLGFGGHDEGSVEVEGAEADAWRGAGFEAALADTEIAEELGEGDNGLVSVAGGDGFAGTFVAEAIEEGAGGDDDGAAGDMSVADENAGDAAALGGDAVHRSLDEGEIGLVGHHPLHEERVVVLADLGA